MVRFHKFYVVIDRIMLYTGGTASGGEHGAYIK